MRIPIPALVLMIVCSSATAVQAQQGRLSVLGGYGGVDHEGGLGSGYHLNLRYDLVTTPELVLVERGPDRTTVPPLRLEGELFAQLGQSGSRLDACNGPGAEVCVQVADPHLLLGLGVASRWDATRAERPLQLYFLPLTAALYLRGYRFLESPVGSPETRFSEKGGIGGGFGNGAGVRVRVRELEALLEVRAILVRDLDGGRAGAIPVSFGFRW